MEFDIYIPPEGILDADCNFRENNCLRCPLPNKKACPKKNNKMETTDFLVITLMMTDECNKNCEYCWHHISDVYRGTMTKENLDNLFAYFKKYYPTKPLVFSALGGEPGLYPELIEHLAKKSLEHQDQKCLIQVYSNGTVNIKQLMEIARKYENIMFNISMNYEAILEEPDCKKYFNIGSIVFSENDNIYEAYEKLKRIKALGYRIAYINFNITDFKVSNKDIYLKKGLDLLHLAYTLSDENFIVMNLMHENSWGFIKFKPQPEVKLNYYPDEKFYLTHFKNAPPIGDLTQKIDLDYWGQYLLDNSPCVNCSNLHICRNYCVYEFIQSDNTIKKQESNCMSKIIRGIGREKYGIEADGRTVYIPRIKNNYTPFI